MEGGVPRRPLSPDRSTCREPDERSLGTTAFQLINVYAMRMAGVFMITTCTLAIRTGIFPRPTAFLGYALALLLLLGSGRLPWVPMAFPVWTLLVSVQILAANFRPGPAHPSGTPSDPADG